MKKVKVLLIFIFGVTLFLAAFLFSSKYFARISLINFESGNLPETQRQFRTYQSVDKDFSIRLPQEYEVEEGITYVYFNKGLESIGLGRNAHAFTTLEEYIADSDQKNRTEQITEIKDLKINGYPARIRDEVRGLVKVRFYYIFTPDWVYVFSTDSEKLYDDLDQITQSFRYTP